MREGSKGKKGYTRKRRIVHGERGLRSLGVVYTLPQSVQGGSQQAGNLVASGPWGCNFRL